MSICLVVGGAGFIGSHVVNVLIEQGHTVIVIDNLTTGHFLNVNPKALLYAIDINDKFTLKIIFDKYQFDYVFHLAAQINLRDSIKDPYNDAQINIMGSLNIINNCVRTKVKKIIFSSTGGAIYSDKPKLPFTERTETKPLSPYGISKLSIEYYLKFYKEIHNLDFAILRYSNVFGPRQNAKGEAGVISIFINKALNKENLNIFGDGYQTRDFIYVEDVAQANLLALKLNGIYNVSTCIETDINSIANEIIKNIDTSLKIEYKDIVPGEIKRCCLSNYKLSQKKWSPKWTLNKGIVETINYFKNERTHG